MAAEYWGAGRVAALTHTDVAGGEDIAFPEDVRSYFLFRHFARPRRISADALVEGAPLANPVNAGASIQALRLAMHRWVAEGIAPPPSVHPKLADGTLTKVEEREIPRRSRHGFAEDGDGGRKGAESQWPDGAGGGAALPLLVPQVDADGNDLAGIRMPDVAVPLGTATGWVFRPRGDGIAARDLSAARAWVPCSRDEKSAATKHGSHDFRSRNGMPRRTTTSRRSGSSRRLDRTTFSRPRPISNRN